MTFACTNKLLPNVFAFQNKYQVFTASDFFSKTHKSNQVEIVAYNIHIIETYIISHVTMY